MTDYNFAIGSLKFKTFKELYDNIKEKHTPWERNCLVMKGDKPLIGFPVKYVLGASPHFFIKWELGTLRAYRQFESECPGIRKELPKMKVVGSVAAGAESQTLYGVLKISRLK